MLNAGFLEFIPKNGKPPVEYCLKVGANKIGTAITEDIRIKSESHDPEPVSCVINVKSNGLATLENKCKHAVLLNGSKMTKVQMLKNNDVFVIAGKRFRYVNNNLPMATTGSVKIEKRQSVMPNFKVKTISRIPVSTKKNQTRRSFSTAQSAKDISRRSCSSALPDRKRSRLFQWETIATPSNGKLLTPSTSMLKSNDLSVTVRKSLFLKNKGDISFRNSKKSITSVLALEDSVCSVVKSAEKSSRGLKRGRSSSSTENRTKRRKHSDHFLFLSMSGCESLFEDSSSSTDSQESPLTSAICKREVQILMTSKDEKPSTPRIKPKSRTPKVQKSPYNDLTQIQGVKKLLRTPKVQKSPRNDLTDVRGVKKFLRTPKSQKSPTNDLTNVRGVKRLMRTPKQQKSPLNDLTNVGGVKKLMKSPKIQKSPLNDLTELKGVKKFLRTPKQPKSPLNDLTNVGGVKKLMRTPKVQKSPLNDLTEIKGLKKFLRTPKESKSPLNDLSNVSGVKEFLRTPKEPKSPVNDLTEIKGVTKMFKNPKVPKSPLNDLSNFSGIENIFATPVLTSPGKDTGNMSGIKKRRYFQKSPKNDLSDVRGVKKLLRTPKPPKNDLSDLEGVKELMTSNTTLEDMYPEHLDDDKIFNSTVLTPNLSIKPVEDEAIQLSQRGRRIRKKQLEDDFVGSPIPVGTRGGTRSRKQKILDEQNSAILISTTPNLENSPAKQVPDQKRKLRDRPKKNTTEDVTNMEEGNPNVTETVQVPRRGGRGRKKNANDEVHEESAKEETSVKRSARGKKNQDLVVEGNEIPDTPRGRRGKILEESSVPEENNKVPIRKRGRGRTPKLEEASLVPEVQTEKRTRGRKAKVVEESSEVVNSGNEEKKGRGRRRKVEEEPEVMEDSHKKIANLQEETSEEIQNNIEVKRGRRRKIEEEPEAVEDSRERKATAEEETLEKGQNGTEEKRGRGRRRKIEKEPEVVEENEVKEKKPARGGKRKIKEDKEVPKTKSTKKQPEESLEIVTKIDENEEINPVKSRKGRNVRKVQTEVDENVQRVHNTRARARK